MELKSLIERVEAATGPDSELDNSIMALFYNREERHIGALLESDFGPDEPVKDLVWVDPNSDKWVSTHASQFTASIDAALALVERCLPGVWYVLAKGRMTSAEPLYGCELLFGHDTQLAIAEGHTQALSIILALLTALDQKEENK